MSWKRPVQNPSTIEEIDERIAQVSVLIDQSQKELDELRQKREVRVTGFPEDIKKLATKLHDALCTYNHTDGCSWGYEYPKTAGDEEYWFRSEHSRWVERAYEFKKFHETVAPTVDFDTFVDNYLTFRKDNSNVF